MNASNLAVKSDIRLRKSSKLKSIAGSCVRALSEYEKLLAGFACDCDVRKEAVLTDNVFGTDEVAIIDSIKLKF